MAIDFPTGPAVNDLYTYNSVTYKWDGVFWSPQLISAISSFLIDDTVNAAVTNFTFTHTTSLTPGAGIGTGISLGAETSSGNVEIGAIIEAVATDATATSEDFDLRFKTMAAGAAATEKMRINSLGLVGINSTTNTFARLEVADPGAYVNLWLTGYANNIYGGGLSLSKTRNAAPAGHTIVQNNDILGYITFFGDDGVGLQPGAEIKSLVDGTPGAGDLPARLMFSTTPDGSATLVERMRIDSKGYVGIGMTPVVGSILADNRMLQVGVGSLGVSGSTAYVVSYSSGGSDKYNLGFQTDCFNPDGYGDGFTAFYARGTVGSPLIVNSGDTVGGLFLQGWDGAAHRNIGKITAVVDGTPGAGDMPGRLEFATTADGASSPTERMRITNYGTVSVNFAGATPLPGEPSRFVIAQPGSDWGLAMCGLDGGGFYGLITATGGATPTSHTVVSASGPIGSWTFMGSDGSVYRRAAQISVNAEGTPSSNNMPAGIYFSTGPGAGSAIINRLRITAAGHIIATSATTTSPTLATNGDWVITPTSNTTARLNYRGSDGVTRGVTFTLA